MSDLIREPDLYLDGRWVPGQGDDCPVECPATEETVAVTTQASETQLDEAVGAARSSFAGWAETSVVARTALLRRLHQILTERADLFAETITKELGTPPPLNRRFQVDVPLAALSATAGALETYPFRSEIGTSLILREPVGVVGAITPWNLPLHQVLVKIAPALAAGNTVVLKPAELTPLASFELARAIEAAGFPAGVFNLVPGPGETIGAALAAHPGIDQISFTGSTAVGRQVMAAAAQTVKRITLELGGKSASVVRAGSSDQTLGTAVKVTVADCYLNGGQTCTALSRLIVPEPLVDAAAELAVAAAARYRPGERLAPLASAEQRAGVSAFLTPEASGGAERVTPADAALPERGYYVHPTVYSHVPPGARIAREEIFGPVLSIFGAADDDEAVALANDTDYGLTGAVWADSEEAGVELARRLRTGQVAVNGGAFNVAAPFGGYKRSGIGRELGHYGIEDTLQLKAIQR